MRFFKYGAQNEEWSALAVVTKLRKEDLTAETSQQMKRLQHTCYDICSTASIGLHYTPL